MSKPQPLIEPPRGPVRACDIEPTFAGGVTTLRYRAVPVWAVCQPRKPVPIYGVVAHLLEQARAFVAAQQRDVNRMDVRPLNREDLAACAVYFDGREQPVPDEDERPGDLPGQRRMF